MSLIRLTFDQEFSRQVPTAEAQAFATRMNSQFIETSAKTSVGVKEAFTEVVERIMDIPELWDSAAGVGAAKSSGGQMPGGGNVTLAEENEQGGGCSC